METPTHDFPYFSCFFPQKIRGGKEKCPEEWDIKIRGGNLSPRFLTRGDFDFLGTMRKKTLPDFSYVKYIPQVSFLPPSHLCSFPDNFDKIKRIKVRFSPFRPWHFCHPRAKADFSSFLSRSTTKRCQLDTEEENSKCHPPPRRRFGFFSPSYRAGKHARASLKGGQFVGAEILK